MKLMRNLVAALALTLACSGCFTLDRAASPLLAANADEHVIVRNYGWNLFGCVPLVCGNADLSSAWRVAFFSDEVTPEAAHAALAQYATESNLDVRDFQVFDDRKAFIVSFSSIPIPWIVQYKEVNVSATLARKGCAR